MSIELSKTSVSSTKRDDEVLARPDIMQADEKTPPLKKQTTFEKLKKSDLFSYVTQAVVAATFTGSFLFGFNLSLLNTSMATIGGDFLWCNYHGYTGCGDFKLKSAFVQTGVFVGAAVGSMTAGRLLVHGCRMVFNVAMGIITLGIVLSCAAPNFAILLIARLIVGSGVGLLAVAVPTYIAEITPPKSRGSYGVMHQLLITVGIFVGVLLGLALKQSPDANGQPEPTLEQMAWQLPKFDKIWWRVMLGLGAIPVFAAAILFNYVYNWDTPYYHITKGEVDEAKQILRRLNDRTDVEDEYEAIVEQIEKAAAAKDSGMSWKKIFEDKQFLYVVFVGCAISAFQQLTGINVFVTSSNKLFASAGLDRNLVTTMSVVLAFVNLIMTFPAIWAIEALGRRTLMLVGLAGMGCSVLPGAVMLWADPASTVTSWVAIAGAIGFIVFFSSTYGPVLWVYLFEIYPAEIKDIASGGATAVNWLAGIAMVFAASFLETDLAYTLFICFCALAFVFIFFTMKESKGLVVGNSPYFPQVPNRAELPKATP